MGYIPTLSVAPCPGCHSICGKPKLRTRLKWRTGRWVRLECACGIAGAWQKPEPCSFSNDWNVAGRGWQIIAGSVARPPPPKPLR